MRAVDAAKALAELTAISSDIQAAAITDDRGEVIAATLDDPEALAAAGTQLLQRATEVRGREPAQLDVATSAGNVFVVCERGRRIVATTVPQPHAPLVLLDLERCLRDAA